MARAVNISSDSVSLVSTDEEPYDEDQEYIVENILAERIEDDGTYRYLVKWENYAQTDNTWEPRESFVSQGDQGPLTIWERRKRMIEKGLEQPFDLAQWQTRMDRLVAAKEERQQKRTAKRKIVAESEKPSQNTGKSSADVADKVIALASDDEGPDDEEDLPPIDQSDSEDDDYQEEQTQSQVRSRSSISSSETTDEDYYENDSSDGGNPKVLRRQEKQPQKDNLQEKQRANSGSAADEFSDGSDDEPLINRRMSSKLTATTDPTRPSKVGATDIVSMSSRPELTRSKVHNGDESPRKQALLGTMANQRTDSIDGDNAGAKVKKTRSDDQEARTMTVQMNSLSKAPRQNNLSFALSKPKGPSKRNESDLATSSRENIDTESQSLPPPVKKRAQAQLPKPILTANWTDPPAKRSKNVLNDGEKLFDKLSIQRRKGKRDLGERAPDANANLRLISLDTTAKPQKPEDLDTQQEDGDEGALLEDTPRRVSQASGKLTGDQHDQHDSPQLPGPSLSGVSERNGQQIVATQQEPHKELEDSPTQAVNVPSPQILTTRPTVPEVAPPSRDDRFRDEVLRSPLSGTQGHLYERNSDRGSDRSDRGVDSGKHSRAYAGPFRSLAVYESPQPLQGHLVFGNHMLPVSCGMPNSAKFLVLDRIKQGTNVHMRIEALITAEDYRRVLHADDKPIYYAIGSVYRRPGPSSDLDTTFKGFVHALRTRNSGAIYFHPEFAFLAWPAGHGPWSFMDAKFPKAENIGLRYVLRVSAPNRPVVITPPSLEREKKVRYGSNATLRALIKSVASVDVLALIAGRPKEVRMFFLLMPEEYRREHDVLTQALRALDYEVFTSYEEGHWKRFIDLATAKKEQRRREPGVVLIHSSFRQFRSIPRMIRALQHGDLSFFILSDAPELTPVVGSGSLAQVAADDHDSIARYNRVSEIFPRNHGRAVCLLDSFFIDGDLDDIRCLLSWFKNAITDSSQFSWRLLVRPHIHRWLQEIVLDQSVSDDAQPRKSAQDWYEICRLVEALIPTEKLSDIYDHEIADPQEDPPLISFPKTTCPGLNWDHPVGKTKGDSTVTRKNDKALFEWFGIWSTTELEHYRHFMVVSGETDKKKFRESSDRWSFESWPYIPMWPAKDFVADLVKPMIETQSRKTSGANLVQS